MPRACLNPGNGRIRNSLLPRGITSKRPEGMEWSYERRAVGGRWSREVMGQTDHGEGWSAC